MLAVLYDLDSHLLALVVGHLRADPPAMLAASRTSRRLRQAGSRPADWMAMIRCAHSGCNQDYFRTWR